MEHLLLSPAKLISEPAQTERERSNISLTSDSDNEDNHNNRKKSLNFKQRKSKWVINVDSCKKLNSTKL